MHTLIEHDYLCYARSTRHGWTAHCVDLDLAACGRTLAEAQKHLQFAISARLATMSGDDLDDDLGVPERPVVWTVSHPTC